MGIMRQSASQVINTDVVYSYDFLFNGLRLNGETGLQLSSAGCQLGDL